MEGTDILSNSQSGLCHLLVNGYDFRDLIVHIHIVMIKLNSVRKFYLYKTGNNLDIH